MIDYTGYAKVVLQKGVNLKEGQNILIGCNAGNYDMARTLGEEAYRSGAGYVQIQVADNHLDKARLEAQGEKRLNYVPNYSVVAAHQRLSEGWATIRIDSTEELGVLEGVDPGKLGILSKAGRLATRFYTQALMANALPWCVICAPGPGWAKKVLGEGANPEELWDVLKPILRLDQGDPLKAWDDHGRALQRRSEILNSKKLDYLHFKGPDTDLVVGLNSISRWLGGPSKQPDDGRLVFNNLPTEEVFTTPDFKRTEGTVKTTKELKVLESPVEGAWFSFKEGKVVDFGADRGQAILEKYLSMDEGARCLGEVALVDEVSPIAKSGLLFGSILYDENASCHIALGAGYPMCLDLPPGTSGEDKLRVLGCNSSLVHTDFMIGSPALDVVGYDQKGGEHPIIQRGSFVL